MLASALTGVAGASEVIECALVAYSNRIKRQWLGVPARVLSEFGAVSPQTARAMAQGIQKTAPADIGISITGIAGPGGGSAEKPIGTVWIATAFLESCSAHSFSFEGTRQQIRQKSVLESLKLARICIGQEKIV